MDRSPFCPSAAFQRLSPLRALLFAAGAVMPTFVESARAQVRIDTITNDVPGTAFWFARACGDVDHDGVPDLEVSGSTFARVYSGLDRHVIHHFNELSSLTPVSVGGVFGDLDGDGFDDVLLGVAEEAPGGAVRVHSGKDGSVLLEVLGPAASGNGTWGLGDWVSSLGDVNADGKPDFAAVRSALGGDTPYSVLVFSGADSSQIFAIDAVEDPNGPTTMNVAPAGDVDGDGHADLVVSSVSSPYFYSGFTSVNLISGANGSLLHDLTDLTDLTNENLAANGIGLDGGADFDGDGVPDVITGTPFGKKQGTHHVGCVVGYSGATGKPLFLREGYDPQGGFGVSLAIAGDVNGDGAIDLACGEPNASGSNGYASGIVHVFSRGFGPRLDAKLEGEAPFSRSGQGVSALLDVNGDGIDDLASIATTDGTTSRIVLDSLANLPLAPASFVPGSRLDGLIADAADSDTVQFAGTHGMTLSLKLAVVSGDLVPRVTIESEVGGYVKSWEPKGPGAHEKQFHLTSDGTYSLSVRGLFGTTGSYRISTARKPKKSLTADIEIVAKGKNGASPAVKFAALEGTIVFVAATPLLGIDDSSTLELESPSGRITSLASFSTGLASNGETWLDGIRIGESGIHRLRWSGAIAPKSKAEFFVVRVPPRGGEVLEID